jgi:glycosyltransferase involved in cell wall biosynthesis
VERARGKWIAILDSDDIWLPDKLKLQIEALTNVGEGCGLCFTDGLFVNNPNMKCGLLENSGIKLQHEYGRIEKPTSFILLPRYHNRIYIQTTLIEKKLLEAVGGFDPKIKLGEDMDMIFKISMQTNFVYVNKSLIKVDRTPHRNQGCLEIYTQDPQTALAGFQHMYENWTYLGKNLQPGLQKTIRTRLACVHSSLANWHILEGRPQEALEELSKAFKLSGRFRWVVKKLLFRFIPSISRQVYQIRTGKDSVSCLSEKATLSVSFRKLS